MRDRWQAQTFRASASSTFSQSSSLNVSKSKYASDIDSMLQGQLMFCMASLIKSSLEAVCNQYHNKTEPSTSSTANCCGALLAIHILHFSSQDVASRGDYEKMVIYLIHGRDENADFEELQLLARTNIAYILTHA